MVLMSMPKTTLYASFFLLPPLLQLWLTIIVRARHRFTRLCGVLIQTSSACSWQCTSTLYQRPTSFIVASGLTM